MAAMNIAVDIPVNPHFNVDMFRHRLQDYAAMLVIMMTQESRKEKKSTSDSAEALAFIQSLAIKGGERIPADVNPVDCYIEEKYE